MLGCSPCPEKPRLVLETYITDANLRRLQGEGSAAGKGEQTSGQTQGTGQRSHPDPGHLQAHSSHVQRPTKGHLHCNTKNRDWHTCKREKKIGKKKLNLILICLSMMQHCSRAHTASGCAFPLPVQIIHFEEGGSSWPAESRASGTL